MNEALVSLLHKLFFTFSFENCFKFSDDHFDILSVYRNCTRKDSRYFFFAFIGPV